MYLVSIIIIDDQRLMGGSEWRSSCTWNDFRSCFGEPWLLELGGSAKGMKVGAGLWSTSSGSSWNPVGDECREVAGYKFFKVQILFSVDGWWWQSISGSHRLHCWCQMMSCWSSSIDLEGSQATYGAERFREPDHACGGSWIGRCVFEDRVLFPYEPTLCRCTIKVDDAPCRELLQIWSFV